MKAAIKFLNTPLWAMAPAGDPPAGDPPADPPPTDPPAGDPPADPPAGDPPADPPADPPPSDPPADPPTGEWREDWREQMAAHVSAGDKEREEKSLKRLQRFATPEAVFGQNMELERLFSSNNVLKMPGEDATDEDWAEFNQKIGAPAAAEEYTENLELPDGVTLGDEDMVVAKQFAERAFADGMTQKAFNGAMNWYNETLTQAREAEAERDEQNAVANKQALREEWGTAYQRNMNAIGSLFANLPGGADPTNEEGVMFKMNNSRLPDGTLWADNPDMMKALHSLAREVNPTATVTEDGMGTIQTVQDELNTMRKEMREDRAAYNRDPAKQERFAELLEAEKRFKQREAG